MIQLDYTMEEAGRHLTGFDLMEIKRQFGTSLVDMDQMLYPYAVYYGLVHHDDSTVTHKDVLSMSLADLEQCFKPADVDADFRDGS